MSLVKMTKDLKSANIESNDRYVNCDIACMLSESVWRTSYNEMNKLCCFLILFWKRLCFRYMGPLLFKSFKICEKHSVQCM